MSAIVKVEIKQEEEIIASLDDKVLLGNDGSVPIKCEVNECSINVGYSNVGRFPNDYAGT
ncbi:hypothetical protein PPYR_07124 [Photinus pyralis]|uniref:Uncharacterized protein n=1 Tax=Photinus pyralis TaxID=7054 RepID=A0A5N4APK2_PHOPY|nr:hypothetical protein PPYR_07124 [Photinus pyralis]